LISACPCENGCPSCVGPTADRSDSTKKVSLEILGGCVETLSSLRLGRQNPYEHPLRQPEGATPVSFATLRNARSPVAWPFAKGRRRIAVPRETNPDGPGGPGAPGPDSGRHGENQSIRRLPISSLLVRSAG